MTSSCEADLVGRQVAEMVADAQDDHDAATAASTIATPAAITTTTGDCQNFLDSQLIAAVESNNPTETQRWLLLQANVEARRQPFIPPRTRGFIESPLEFVETIAQSYPVTSDNPTPLLVAAAKGFTSIVTLLLDHRADREAMDIHGQTALHVAASTDHLDVVEILLTAGALVNCQTMHRQTPLHLVCARVKSSNRDKRLLRVRLIKVLLERGADANCQDFQLQTPLHLVCSATTSFPESKYVCDLLLAASANPNLRNSWHKTPAKRANAELRALLKAASGRRGSSSAFATALPSSPHPGVEKSVELLRIDLTTSANSNWIESLQKFMHANLALCCHDSKQCAVLFECLVCALLGAEWVGGSGDDGIDGRRHDTVIQCKAGPSHEGSGRKILRELIGTCAISHVRVGVLAVTSETFPYFADYAIKSNVDLQVLTLSNLTELVGALSPSAVLLFIQYLQRVWPRFHKLADISSEIVKRAVLVPSPKE